jgi:hypothetical protein
MIEDRKKKAIKRLDDLATEAVGHDVLDVAFMNGPLTKIDFMGRLRQLSPDGSELANSDIREMFGLIEYLVDEGIVYLDNNGRYTLA